MIYEQLAYAKAEFHKTEIKKTGKNKHMGYEYFELGDFIKPIIELLSKYDLVSFTSFTSDTATLKVVNIKDISESIEITSPMSTAQLRGCHEVQNLGAVQTYLRRYLYTALFDIIENDALEATTGKAGAIVEKSDEDLQKELQESIQSLKSNLIKAGYDVNYAIDKYNKEEKKDVKSLEEIPVKKIVAYDQTLIKRMERQAKEGVK